MESLLEQRNLLFDSVADSMEELLILVDSECNVMYFNRAAKEALGLTEGCIGRHVFDELKIWIVNDDRNHTIIHEVLKTRMAQKGLRRQTIDGRELLINIVPMSTASTRRGVLITAQNISHVIAMEQELDMAFALTLPNSKVEYRLKSIPEYQDLYDTDTKFITITGVIADGGHRHVVNCLKIFSVLVAKGVTRLIGIDKDSLVQAFIFHDLGKSQPVLQTGDKVDPKIVFENGKLHAARGADIAKYYYQQKDDIVTIIRYHHHGESELPNDFPQHLLPMFRLFQIVDGLSAAVTRGGVNVSLDVHDCVITIQEVNRRPQYNGTRHINLYTGQSEWIPIA
ncbi:PAS domain-containing protein [Alicyclobacillus dauci]|uniref:PAS domain S-box protein n=1 Tax=Alicyclobacillus dauci TaxID=1475485 RepID=A0ABY6Z7R3_9BACL|nr:PAS domain S-box protein [Alicyclobacillus dauci]WAH38568.1 PAS domain S-box protein [Alicyclobacillus dauci]